MSTNFFDDLEQQLVAATTDRTRRLRRARRRSIATLCTILVALLAAGGGIAAALSNSTNNSGSAPAGRSTTPSVAPPAATVAVPSAVGRCAPVYLRGKRDGVVQSSVVVAVLNGTTVPGLARGVATTLQNTQYKIGTVTNAATQDQAITRVYYAHRDCATAATLVAQSITLARLQADAVVRPTTPALRTIAGERADVVVVVGSDASGVR